jgi:hypothetical protein
MKERMTKGKRKQAAIVELVSAHRVLSEALYGLTIGDSDNYNEAITAIDRVRTKLDITRYKIYDLKVRAENGKVASATD